MGRKDPKGLIFFGFFGINNRVLIADTIQAKYKNKIKVCIKL